mgnify:FL=1
MEYKFNGSRYVTRGISLGIPSALVMYLWGIIEERKKNKGVPMDYLQIFKLKSERKNRKRNLIITLSQEQPPYEEVHIISKFSDITEKIYVTMLLPEEY